MILRQQKGLPLSKTEMDANILELSNRVSLNIDEIIQGVKTFDSMWTGFSDILDNSNRIVNTKHIFDTISSSALNKFNKSGTQNINVLTTFSMINVPENLVSNKNPIITTDFTWMISSVGKLTVSESTPVNPDSPSVTTWMKISTTTPRSVLQVYKFKNGSWELTGLNSPIHQYHFSSSSTGFNDRVGTLNWSNTGLTLYSGYTQGNGYTQYATLAKNSMIDTFYTYSIWAQTPYTFLHYQLMLGSTGCRDTYGNSGYGWFFNIYNNRTGSISGTFDNVLLSLNTWYNFIFSYNASTRIVDVYVNGNQIYTGTNLSQGTNLGTGLQLAGFTSFSSTYTRGPKIASMEIYAGRISADQAPLIYQKGMYPI